MKRNMPRSPVKIMAKDIPDFANALDGSDVLYSTWMLSPAFMVSM